MDSKQKIPDSEKHKHEPFMRRAIQLSEKASMIEKSGGVFGAVIVKDGIIIAEGYNQVIRHNDPTWHAEMHAIREACKKLKSPHIKGCVMYTSAEPCPMCFAAAYWAHIGHIYFGARVEDSKKYGDFQDILIYEDLTKKPHERNMPCTEYMRDEANVIWEKFSKMSDRAQY